MYLKKFIFVNWGNIPNLEFEFGPINLFSGGNGSGKTTAADAIQTIMTAAHENLFQYNPGQDETTQRGRGGKRVRTLASYVLGCDDGSYARLDATDGYLAAVFYPTRGETAAPFTAVIGIRAWLDSSGNTTTARQDEALFMILPGETLSLAHFVREDTAGKYVTPLDKIQKLLIVEFGNRHVEKYDTKRSYLRRLYAVLRGRDDSVSEQEALAAAKAFSRFMAYKPVQSIDKFVADEILEKKDLGEAIRSIAGQLKTIHGMERDASRLIDSISTLEQAKRHGEHYIEHWIELNTLEYTLDQYQFLKRKREYLQAKKKQQDYRQSISTNGSETELAQQRREHVRHQLVSLEAQRMGVDTLKQKDEMEQRREQRQRALVDFGKQLLIQDSQLSENARHSRTISENLRSADLFAELPALNDLNSAALCQQVVAMEGRGDIDFHTLLNRDITSDLSPLEHHLEQARRTQRLYNQWVEHWHAVEESGARSLRDQLARLANQHESRYETLANQRKQKHQEIERLEAREVVYPAYVERALVEIRKVCPQADPRVLCDHIEVTDARWQAAIEGYLGGARYSIIVEPAYEAQAIRAVRGIPGRDNRARVIQGEKARTDAQRVNPAADSIIHLLDFSHATARDYVTASYANVLQVASAEELRHTRRGLTADGMAAGNYSMWRCDLPDGDLVFGTAARERALHAKRGELDKLVEEWQSADQSWRAVTGLLAAVDGLKRVDYADVIATMLSLHGELQKLDESLAQLDVTEYQDLESKLEDLRQEERHWSAQVDAFKEQKGELQEKLREVTQRCQDLSEQQEQTRDTVERREQNLQEIATEWSDFDVEARIEHATNEAQDLDAETTRTYRKEIEKRLHAYERKMNEAIQSHNQYCRPTDTILYQSFDGTYDGKLFRGICGLQRDIDRVYNQLKNNILVAKHQQLTQLKESFNNAFVTHLCHAIHQSINDGKRHIELLNRELQHHRFGADRETFRFDSEWIPEYRDYARFFEEVIKNPVLGDGGTLFNVELSRKSAQVRDNLMAMLLDEDEQKALRELERIADYRNYRRYEIYKEVEGKQPIALSEYGTGSGGQLETPAYIIRAAAITSSFRFAEGNNHLRMVLVDEAFSKMDESRSREVIRYLTEALGLQLVFIMPTSKCGPFMELVSNEFVFAKCPSQQQRGQLRTRVLVDRKECDQEKVKNLWAHHRRTIYRQAELDFMDEVVG